MTHYVFEEVVANGLKRGKCTGCGQNIQRQKKFTNTISPFNKNPDGTVRTPDEVQANVNRIRDEWEAEPLVHDKCKARS